MTLSLFPLRRLPGVARVARALGISGVPVAGYFGAGWSLGTLLLLYWLETILVTLTVTVLVLRHRQVTRKAGHWNVPYTVTTTGGGRSTTRSGNTTFLASFLGMMIPFTAVHGLFIGIFAWLVFPQELGPGAGVSADALGSGMSGIAIALLVSLLLDLPGLGERPFRWVERIAQRAQGRMLVTHLTILFGAFALLVFEAPLGFFAVFVGLKALLDLGSMLPDRSSEPRPSRAAEALGRLLPKRDGQSFGDHYRQEVEAQRTRSQTNEEVVAHQTPPP